MTQEQQDDYTDEDATEIRVDAKSENGVVTIVSYLNSVSLTVSFDQDTDSDVDQINFDIHTLVEALPQAIQAGAEALKAAADE